MLVLSRKKGEEIVIEGGIKLTVLGVDGGRVRLGIEAPKGLRVNRGEVEGALKGLAAVKGAAS